MHYLVANFKSHKTTREVLEWLSEVAPKVAQRSDIIQVIVCPQFTSLASAKQFLLDHNLASALAIGSQDISAFGEGKFTGEVNAKALAEYAKYSIIGHSERRRLFTENSDTVAKKIDQALAFNITPIVCFAEDSVEDVHLLKGENGLVAFEPPAAIGTGNPASTATVAGIVQKVHSETKGNTPILYGGSVDGDTVHNFLAIEHLQGFLVATASLDPQAFLTIYNGLRESHNR